MSFYRLRRPGGPAAFSYWLGEFGAKERSGGAGEDQGLCDRELQELKSCGCEPKDCLALEQAVDKATGLGRLRHVL